MPTLDEILAKGSKSFRRLNSATAAPVSNPGAKKPAASVPVVVVAPATPDAEPEPYLREALERYAQAQGGRPTATSPRPHVHFHLHRVRLLDGDNKYGSVKLLLDACRYAGLIHNDTEEDIDLTVTQTRVAHFADQGTGVVITYH